MTAAGTSAAVNGPVSAEDFTKALLNLLEDFAREKTRLEETQRAMLNILEDFGVERANLREALANVKALSGMLPICANCKKIRDDSGYWQQVEAYIQTHSDAVFSHGICPECARKLYPEIDWDKRDKAKK